jgi:D-alanyl-D-alanine dipeptidase
MQRAFANFWHERRVTTGPNAVVEQGRDRLTDAQILQIQSAAVRVTGQPPNRPMNRLQPEAARSFEQMAEAAAREGIQLVIGGSGQPRLLATARRRAGQNPNQRAVAQGLSAHVLGLAVDLDLIPGKREDFNTLPMQEVVNRMSTAAHKWTLIHGPAYGWFPYRAEPWHFEYNPEGYREQFRATFGLRR